MFIAYTVVAVLLALVLLASAYAKLSRHQQVVDGLSGIGVPLRMFGFLAACEIAGAAGLIAGLWYRPLGLAAAGGVVLYFLVAVGAHLRERDFKGMPNAVVIEAAAVTALLLLAAS